MFSNKYLRIKGNNQPKVYLTNTEKQHNSTNARNFQTSISKNILFQGQISNGPIFKWLALALVPTIQNLDVFVSI